MRDLRVKENLEVKYVRDKPLTLEEWVELVYNLILAGRFEAFYDRLKDKRKVDQILYCLTQAGLVKQIWVEIKE